MARAAPDYDVERGACVTHSHVHVLRWLLTLCLSNAERCKSFLTTFASAYEADGALKYMDQLVRRLWWYLSGRPLVRQGPPFSSGPPLLGIHSPPVPRLPGARSKRWPTGRGGRWTSSWTTWPACVGGVATPPAARSARSRLPGPCLTLAPSPQPPPQFASPDGVDLAQAVVSNTRRYQSLFCDAADECLPQPTQLPGEDDVFDVLLRQVRHPHAPPPVPCW